MVPVANADAAVSAAAEACGVVPARARVLWKGRHIAISIASAAGAALKLSSGFQDARLRALSHGDLAAWANAATVLQNLASSAGFPPRVQHGRP